MDAQNILKGRVLESLLATAFRRAKYTVIPLGVEHQFPDIDELAVSQYLSLLPAGLRLLPDLMVYRWEGNQPKIFFVESKFRTKLSRVSVQGLKKDLVQQAKHWENTFCVLAVANQPTKHRGGDYQQNYIRVVRASEAEDYPDYPFDFWRRTHRMDKIFHEFKSFLKDNPLSDLFGDDYAATLEPLLDDSVRILKTLGDLAPRRR